MASNKTFFLVVGSYLIVLLLSYLGNIAYFNNNTADDLNESTLTAYSQPFIGKNNATKLIKQRIQVVKDKYQAILQSSDWTLLRASTNVTIEILTPKTPAKWPLYIKTTASIPSSPKNVFNLFQWSNLQATGKAIDPFFEDISLVLDPAREIKVFRRVRFII
jgi:hypothetical protein